MATLSLKHLPHRLKALATTNSGVLVYVTIGNVALRMVSSIFLTRMLLPEAFGIVGIIGSIFYVVVMMGDLGFNAYIIRDQRGDDPHFLDALWTLHVVRGVLFAIVGVAITPLLALILDKPALLWPATIAMTTLAISGLQSFGSITALRHGGAKRLSLFDLAGSVIQVTINLTVAFWLRNVWALIIAMLVSTTLKTALSYYVFRGVRHRFVYDRAIVREFLSFSKMVATSSVITLLMAQSDKLVLARLFTLAEFGIYTIAITLATAPSSFAESYIGRVVYPKYTQIIRSEPDEVSGFYYTTRRLQSLVYAFGCGGIIGAAHLIVAILYDPRYIGAASYLSILTVASLFRLPNVAAAEFLMAMGNYKPWLHSNIVRLAWVATVGCGCYLLFGAIGVVFAVGTAEMAAMILLSLRLREVQVFDWREEGLFIGTALVGAAIGYAVSVAIHAAWPAL